MNYACNCLFIAWWIDLTSFLQKQRSGYRPVGWGDRGVRTNPPILPKGPFRRPTTESRMHYALAHILISRDRKWLRERWRFHFSTKNNFKPQLLSIQKANTQHWTPWCGSIGETPWAPWNISAAVSVSPVHAFIYRASCTVLSTI